MFGPNSREVVREFGKKIIELTTKGLETTKGKCGREKVMPNEGLRASQLSIPRFPSTFAKTGRTSPFPHIHFPSEPNGLERIAKHPFRGVRTHTGWKSKHKTYNDKPFTNFNPTSEKLR